MSTLFSNITLYAGVPFTPDKNFQVEDLTDYLATLSATRIKIITPANYIQQQLKFSIMLELEQEALYSSANNWNYCTIQVEPVGTGTIDGMRYYFITNKEWRSTKVVKLDLVQDVLNNYWYGLKLSPKTLVKREHKDRWDIDTVNRKLYPIIDREAEGFSPVLYKTEEIDLKPTNEFECFKWYLVYLNKNDISQSDYNQVNPVRAGIAPAHNLSAYVDGSYTLNNSVYTMISPFHNNTNGGGRVRLGTNTYIPVTMESIEDIDISSFNFSAYPTTKYIVRWADCYYLAGDWKVIQHVSLYDEDILLLHDTAGTVQTGSSIALLGFNGAVKVHEMMTQHIDPKLDPTATLYGAVADFTGIDTLDKTDQSLLKIVELPYCPIKVLNITSSGYYIFDLPIDELSKSGSNYKFIEIKGKNLEYLENEELVYNDVENFLVDSVGVQIIDLDDISSGDLREDYNDPKLLNSNFTSLKFIYDTFNKDLKLEDVNMRQFANLQDFKLKQISSLALTSKFMFDTSVMFPLRRKIEDYSDVIPVSRNNEVCIYNNQYLNYLRTSLQYDLKAKNEQMQENITRGVMAGVGALAAVGVGVATGGAGAIGAAIGGGLAGAQNVYTIFNSEAKAQEALEAKQAQLKTQKSSVIGADDLGLLKYYTKGNWAKIALYDSSYIMQDKLQSLFDFTGYTSEYQGIPVKDSRLRWNYIQADIDIDTTASDFYYRNIPAENIEAYKACWSAGVTIIHHFNNTWDFKQMYQNWEKSLQSYL